MGALSSVSARAGGMCRIVATLLAAVALAAQAAPAHADPQHAFNITAQPLDAALKAFALQAQREIFFTPDLTRGRQTHGVSGKLQDLEALKAILDGTGLTYTITASKAILVVDPTAPPAASAGTGAPAAATSAAAATSTLSGGAAVGPQTATANPDGTTNSPTPAAAAAAGKPSLEEIIILGSLLPRAKIETASPLLTITAEDIKNQGFSSVADALQATTVNTGAINNTSINTGDIWAAKTLSLFGLDPSYTKFLIDGRPMPLFSQVAQTQTVDQLYTNLSGIPIDLVERIEILPGGQSSLYGSDAIAGVVNIVLKKHVEFGSVDARLGWYGDGGGRERALSASDTLQIGKLNLMLGAQVSDQQPIWAFQRGITAQNFDRGLAPQQPASDAFVTSIFTGQTYFPAQPADCAPRATLFGGTERYYQGSFGPYCGSVSSSAFSTLMNKDRSAALSLHANYELGEASQLYGDLLYSYEEQAHQLFNIFATLYDDPNLQDVVFALRTFAPEEMSTDRDGLLGQKNYENTYTATVGGKTKLGAGWNLDVAFTTSYEHSNDHQVTLLNNNVPGSFGNTVLGPQLGTDLFAFPMYAANYTLMMAPVTPAQFASYLGYASVYSNNRTNQLRAQLTQSSLFTLPGGDAGLAVVAEQGYESWTYRPAELLTSGQLLGIAWNPSDGHRNRYATAAEMNLPWFRVLSTDLSARYDAYDAEGARFNHTTYSAGLELRPVDGLLLRGKYSTSFKAPSLIDEFEGGSTSQTFVTDWANCARLGFTGKANISNCPPQYYSVPATVVQASNPHLQPLTASTLSYGVVWSPTMRLSMSLDYQHIKIHNEVLKENPDYLGQSQVFCSNGTLDPQSPSCQAANAQIVRAPAPPGSPLLGRILEVTTTKINLAQETNNSLLASFEYRFDIGRLGHLGFKSGYTRLLDHRQRTFPGDPLLDFLRNPGLSTEFQTRANASLTWGLGKWNATLFGNWFGPTPNYVAQHNNSYSVPEAGKVAAWRIFNASVNYSPLPALRLSLRANNLGNSMPPLDVTQPGNTNQPFTPGNYNPYGREVLIEAQYQFGRGRH